MSSIVLVHGAWSDASAWDEVAHQLSGAGHRAMLSRPGAVTAAITDLITTHPPSERALS